MMWSSQVSLRLAVCASFISVVSSFFINPIGGLLAQRLLAAARISQAMQARQYFLSHQLGALHGAANMGAWGAPWGANQYNTGSLMGNNYQNNNYQNVAKVPNGVEVTNTHPYKDLAVFTDGQASSGYVSSPHSSGGYGGQATLTGKDIGKVVYGGRQIGVVILTVEGTLVPIDVQQQMVLGQIEQDNNMLVVTYNGNIIGEVILTKDPNMYQG